MQKGEKRRLASTLLTTADIIGRLHKIDATMHATRTTATVKSALRGLGLKGDLLSCKRMSSFLRADDFLLYTCLFR